jgi:hypothetical protein
MIYEKHVHIPATYVTYSSITVWKGTSRTFRRPNPDEERSGQILAKYRSVCNIHNYTTLADMLRLFNNAEYSDATIRIHDKILPIHKTIICTQSAYFRNAFRAEFVEGSTGLLTFNDGSGAAYWRVFEYLYTGNYPDDLANDFEGDEVLATHVFKF